MRFSEIVTDINRGTSLNSCLVLLVSWQGYVVLILTCTWNRKQTEYSDQPGLIDYSVTYLFLVLSNDAIEYGIVHVSECARERER